MVERCLWDEGVGAPGGVAAPLPGRTDVAIVGGGYTGLSAARTLARNGVAVAVLERHRIGWGASGRNGGFVLPGFQPDPDHLTRRYGVARARALFAASLEAIGCLERLIADESIDCGYMRVGSVTLAARPGHPGRYCAGLAAAAAVRAGAVIVEGIEVLGTSSAGGRTTLATSGGPLTASGVLVATNGYTGPAFPALRRRVVPIGSSIVATRRLEPAVARGLLPRGRVMSDTWHRLHYFRRSDDGRILFGGRASFTPTTIERSAAILARAMREVFPSLAEEPVEYAWTGTVCFDRDRMPHAGRADRRAVVKGGAGPKVEGVAPAGRRSPSSPASRCGRSRSMPAPHGSCRRWAGTIGSRIG
ncbi:FAD-binding oxidoreductase [soil metagenome]